MRYEMRFQRVFPGSVQVQVKDEVFSGVRTIGSTTMPRLRAWLAVSPFALGAKTILRELETSGEAIHGVSSRAFAFSYADFCEMLASCLYEDTAKT